MRRAFILISLIIAIVPMMAHGTANNNQCAIARKMLSIDELPDFAAGWKYSESKCRETGIYKLYFTSKDGSRIGVAVTLMPQDLGAKRKSSHQIFLGEEDGNVSGVEELLGDIDSRISVWEKKSQFASNVSMVVFVIILALSLTIISYAYSASRIETVASLKINAALFGAIIFLIFSASELIMRIGNIYPSDSRLMSFMSDVRQQRIISGGFRRVDDSTEHAEKSSDKDINSIGYRGGEFPLEKNNTLRIACAGDSFMFGIGVEPGNVFTEKLQKFNKENGYETQVFNYGVPGANAGDIVGVLLTESIVEDPDVAIWGFVLNDIEITPGGSRGAYYDGVGIRFKNLEDYFQSHDLGGLRKYIRTYNYAIGVLEDRALNESVIDMYNDSYDNEKNPEEMAELERFLADLAKYYSEREKPFFIFIYPLLLNLDGGYPFDQAHGQIKKSAEKFGIPVLDLLPYYQGENEKDLWVSLTDHHPNARGQEIAARAVAEYLDKNILAAKVKKVAFNALGTGWNIKNVKTHDELLELASELENNGTSCEAHKKATEYFIQRQLLRVTKAKLNRMRTLGSECEKEAAILYGKVDSKASLE